MTIKKRFCFFAPNLLGGGAERVISILVKNFADRGYVVDLILAEAIGPYLNDIPESVRIINFKSKKLAWTLPQLIQYLRTYTPDVLFTSHMHASTVSLVAAKLSLTKTRVIIRQPTMLSPYLKKKSINSELRKKIYLNLSKQADQIIVTSNAMAEEFQKNTKVVSGKIKTIHNPMPIALIQKKSLETVDHFWFDSGELPVIIAVGRLVKVKDFQTLIKAFYIVQKSTPSRLVILGEGDLRAELETLIDDLGLNNSVYMPGFVSNPYKYIRLSKVFVLSSLWEGFPNGMVEAMICGASIVSTNCDGGAAEILDYGKFGKLVPVQNENVMASAIEETLNIEVLSVFERANDFSLSNVLESYNSVFI